MIVARRTAVTLPEGLEIIGDSPYPEQLDELLARLSPADVEMALCG